MPEMPADRPGRTWWRDGVLYQLYPRSFADSNGDGIGDLRGITGRLDHLQWLGVDGIWLSPITVSPNDDWGYDVADYCDVDPTLGTLADAEEMIAEAARRDIRVILDLVPNHTSDRHPWFLDAAVVARLSLPRLVRVGRPEARRLAAEQLDEHLPSGPARVDPRRDHRPVLPAQLPPVPARPQLVEPRGPRRVRPHPAGSGSTAVSPASGSTSAT